MVLFLTQYDKDRTLSRNNQPANILSKHKRFQKKLNNFHILSPGRIVDGFRMQTWTGNMLKSLSRLCLLTTFIWTSWWAKLLPFVSPNFSGQKVRHLRTASHLCSVCGLQDSLSNLNLWSLNIENNRGVIFRRWLFPSCCSPLVLGYTGVWGWLVLSESPFFIAVDSTDPGRSHMLGNVQLCTKWFVIVDNRSQDQGLLLGGKKIKKHPQQNIPYKIIHLFFSEWHLWRCKMWAKLETLWLQ